MTGAAIALGAITLASTVESDVAATHAAHAQEQQIDLQSNQQIIQNQQQKMQNYDRMIKTLDTQQVQAVGKGVSEASPTFGAIQRATYNTGAKENKNLETEQSLIEASAKAEKQSVQQKLQAQLFSSVANIATIGLSEAPEFKKLL